MKEESCQCLTWSHLKTIQLNLIAQQLSWTEVGFLPSTEIREADHLRSTKENSLESQAAGSKERMFTSTRCQTTRTTMNGTTCALKTSEYSGTFLIGMRQSTTTSMQCSLTVRNKILAPQWQLTPKMRLSRSIITGLQMTRHTKEFSRVSGVLQPHRWVLPFSLYCDSGSGTLLNI